MANGTSWAPASKKGISQQLLVPKRCGVTADVSRTHAGRLRGVHGPAPPSECQSRNRSLLIETEICDFRRDRESCSLLSPAEETPWPNSTTCIRF